MRRSPSGFDRQYVLPTSHDKCRIWLGLDVYRGDVQRFLVQLQEVSPENRVPGIQIARIDHNPAGIDGHDVRTEGVHVDVVIEDGEEQTVFPKDPPARRDLGAVINNGKLYFRRHAEYFLRVHRREIEPENPPPWPWSATTHDHLTLICHRVKLRSMTDRDSEPIELTHEEFTEELARLLDRDPEELRAKTREIEWEPPWEAAQRKLDE